MLHCENQKTLTKNIQKTRIPYSKDFRRTRESGVHSNRSQPNWFIGDRIPRWHSPHLEHNKRPFGKTSRRPRRDSQHRRLQPRSFPCLGVLWQNSAHLEHSNGTTSQTIAGSQWKGLCRCVRSRESLCFRMFQRQGSSCENRHVETHWRVSKGYMLSFFMEGRLGEGFKMCHK